MLHTDFESKKRSKQFGDMILERRGGEEERTPSGALERYPAEVRFQMNHVSAGFCTL